MLRRMAMSLVLILALAQLVSAQDVNAIVLEAAEAYQQRDYGKSAQLYAAAIEKGAKSAVVFYNAACSFALAGKKEEAFRYLEKAAAAGYRDVNHLKQDADLTGLRGDARWPVILGQMQAASDAFLKTIGNQALRLELLQRQKEDQAIRVKVESSHSGAAIADHAVIDELERVDTKNTARMKEIVDQHGWPGKSLVGADGATAAWLLVQHADADPKFQRRCLELIKVAAAKGEVSMHDLAYLTDRVLVNEGKKQLYGTQFTSENGELVPRPIEDEANIDKRRKEAGLPSMEEATKWMKGHAKTSRDHKEQP